MSRITRLRRAAALTLPVEQHQRGGVTAVAGPLIVCAPNAFKGTLTAAQAAAAMALGVRRAVPDACVVEVPVADGGDGTLDVLLHAAGTRGRIERHEVSGPVGIPVVARLGWLDPTTAVVELAEAAGLRLLPVSALQPLEATSRGVGELMARALDGGAARVVVGVGGSACTDGAAGLVQALGLRVLDATGTTVAPGGGGLSAVEHVDAAGLDPRLAGVTIEVAVDTRAPLLGVGGAAHLYGPQKGATPAQVDVLEAAMQRWAGVLERDLGVDPGLRAAAGAGAAGACAYGLAAVVGARIVSGGELVCDAAGLDAALAGANLVLTGEGRVDASTATGKAPHEVARRAAAAGVACVAIAGSLDGVPDQLFAEVVELAPGLPRAEVMALGAQPLADAAAAAVSRWWR
jgi:glycerate 2-kinase